MKRILLCVFLLAGLAVQGQVTFHKIYGSYGFAKGSEKTSDGGYIYAVTDQKLRIIKPMFVHCKN